MTVLITAASKHGSTTEIAKTIQNTLNKAGCRTVRLPPEEVLDVSIYDAVVLGSAVYAGNWMKPAKAFAFDHARALQRMPVWLFSSGPVGKPLKPADDKTVNIDSIVDLTGAKEHMLFAGKIDRAHLGFAERALTHALGVKPGDFRDWKAIEAWGAHIAHELSKTPVA